MSFRNAQNIDASGSNFNDVRGHQYNINLSNSALPPFFPGMSLDLSQSRTPPPAPSLFFGRDDFVTRAVELIQSSQPARLAILGPGGIGKTSVALAILHHQMIKNVFQDNCYFVQCEAITSSHLLVLSILQVLGIQQSTDPLSSLNTYLQCSAPMLIVLDNFETPWDSDFQTAVESVLQRIAAIKTVALIITMRGTVSPFGIQWTSDLILGPLSLEAAKSAFLAAHSVDSVVHHTAELDVLLEELDCVPLAVMLMAQLHKSQTYTLLLKRWKKEKTSLLKIGSRQPGRLNSVDVSIMLSLKAIAYEQDALLLLSLICYLPDGVLEWETKLSNMATSFQNAEAIGALLKEVALVYVDIHGTMKVLSPIRHYMLEHYPVRQSDVVLTRNYFFTLLSDYRDCKLYQLFEALQQIIPNEHNITCVIQDMMKGQPGINSVQLAHAAYDLSLILFLAYKRSAAFDLLTEVNTYYQSNRLSMDDAEPKIYKLMAEMLFWQHKTDEALEKMEHAEILFRQNGTQPAATHCLHTIGLILYMHERSSEAAAKLDKAANQYIEMDNHEEAFWCLEALGKTLLMLGRDLEAREKLCEADQQWQIHQLSGKPASSDPSNSLNISIRFSLNGPLAEKEQAIKQQLGRPISAYGRYTMQRLFSAELHQPFYKVNFGTNFVGILKIPLTKKRMGQIF